jgi:O-antigen/teichoic acid export membrane protein
LVDSFGVLTATMNKIIVGVFLGPAVVAVVEIAEQVQAGADAILAAVTSAVMTSASWLNARKGDQELAELVIRGVKYSLLVSFSTGAGAMVLISPLIGVWVGHQYNAVIPLAIAALACSMITAPVQVPVIILRGTGQVSSILKPYVIATLVNVMATIILVKWIGAIGAFIATIAVIPIYLVPVFQQISRRMRVQFDVLLSRSITPATVPTMVMVVAVATVAAVLHDDWAKAGVGVATGAIVFFFTARITAISTVEMRELRHLAMPSRRG